MATGDDDRKHDTDPLADTQTSDSDRSAAEISREPGTAAKKKRAVHAGDTLGRYELVEDVGEGGMATVYRARDKELRRDVAVKVLFPHLARRPDVVRRFQREARAAAVLEHPNILRIYDVGDASGDEGEDPPFIVMELVRGSTLLGEIEQRGPMFAEVCACVGALLADALAAAHQAGIIHRDVKPANVLIAQGGRVLLADFGVARLETEDSLVTKTGALLGTPAYMSPEQASGDTATAKSDLYSLGATLYQLATGTLPYAGSPAKVLAQIAAGQRTPAVKKRAAVGPDLSRVIDRLMAAEPEQRPASAKDVAAELRAIASAGGLGDPADELKAYFADPDAFVRAKTPAVVTAIVAAAKTAIGESKLPRAMALADRASVLAPGDPAVTQLIATVTEGDRASRRRRVLAIGALGLAVLGGAAATGYELSHRAGAMASDAASAGTMPGDGAVAMLGDGGAMVGDGGAGAMPGDGGAVAMLGDGGAVAMLGDAGATAMSDGGAVAMLGDAGAVALRRDAGAIAMVADAGTRTRRDAGVAIAADAASLDAPMVAVVPPDAPSAPPVDAAPAMGAIVVVNDTWCNVSIDGGPSVRRSDTPIRVTAGHHVVTCAQDNTDRTWTREVDVAPGATARVKGAMLGTVLVSFDVDATLDGTAHTRGTKVAIQAGRIRIQAGGVDRYVTIRFACVVRAQPELGCYPLP